ncbi:glutathione S-transferase-like [Hirundo rustica]|nr:glutathione S-transferase-like [Hirundo rustica]
MRSRNSEEEELKNTVDNQPYAALSMPLTSENGMYPVLTSERMLQSGMVPQASCFQFVRTAAEIQFKKLKQLLFMGKKICQFKSLGRFFSLIGYGWKLPQAAQFKQPWITCLYWVESKLRSEGNQELKNMSGKPRLTYLNGRGRMESIRWLLAAAGVEFEEVYLETKEQYDKLIKDGFLLFQQVPLVEIDGMKMVQTRAIMSYIAGKYNLHGKDLKERAMIDMYVEGISDLMQMILMFPFSPPDAKEKNLESIKEKATNRYFPVFEKVLKQHGQDFLVGNKFSWADVQLMEAILAVEEKVPAVLSGFPQLQVFKTKMSNMPTIKKFLQPGSPRKPPPDAHYVETVLKIFRK